MAENVTAHPSLSYRTSGYVDIGENPYDNDCPSLPDEWIFFALICVGICLCGLVGNGTVLWFLGCKMKQNPFTVYILNLAAADFSLLLLFALLLLIIWLLTKFCLYNCISFYIDFAVVVELLCHFFDLSSLGLLTAISVERCISVLFPIWYRCQRPKHSAGITCGVLWVLTGILISLMYLSISFAPSYLTASAGIAIAFSLILLSLMLISDLFFFVKLMCGSRRRHPGRLFFAVLLNVIIFFAFAFDSPGSVDVFLNLTTLPELFPEISTFLLRSLNSSINPIIYILVGSCQKCWLQCSVNGALRRLFEEKTMPEERSSLPEDDEVVETSL